MTDNEIINNIIWCLDPKNACADCPYYELRKSLDCVSSLFRDTLDLINRQKAEIKVKNKLLDIAEKKFKKYDAEIEELAYKLGSLLCHATGSKLSKHTYPLHIMESYVNDTIQDYCEEAEAEAKAEAYKECIEKAKDLFPKEDWFTREAFDNLLKELGGEDNEN